MKNDLEKILYQENFSNNDIVKMLSVSNVSDQSILFKRANEIREQLTGRDIYLRGIIEFSNNCRLNCLYCGLRVENFEIERYRIPFDEIIKTAIEINSKGIKTIVLQSGEDLRYSGEKIAELIKKIKLKIDTAITLSLGERDIEDYQMWKEAGADRYLLKHETANREIYKHIHPTQVYENKINNLKSLKEIGFQTGSGNIVGLPGQTLEDIADDLLLCSELDVDMASFSPFISAENTPLENHTNGNLELLLNTMAAARIVLKNVHIPATTALSTLDKNGRKLGLLAGANVIMPNFTPLSYRSNYKIYNGKNNAAVEAEENLKEIKSEIESLGMTVSDSHGHSLKLLK